jgi:DNA mismatch repair protein MutS
LHEKEGIQARTLFATHYHELTNLERILNRVENHHVKVKEFKDKIIFLRSIEKGAGDKSYGIYVAKMAGLPNSVISRASEVLDYHINKSDQKDETFMIQKASNQISIFNEEELLLRKRINELDLNTMTPIEALHILDDIKKEHDI